MVVDTSAGLNIGDCCAYALAKYSGEPLLLKVTILVRQTFDRLSADNLLPGILHILSGLDTENR